LGSAKRARREDDRRRFHLAIEAIACNLTALPLLDAKRPLAVPRSSGVMWAEGRYRNPVYGVHFLNALDLMARPEVGLIEVLTRGYRFAGGGKQRSTIKPTVTFAGDMPPSLIRWESFDRAEEPEVLILKRPKVTGGGTGRRSTIATQRKPVADAKRSNASTRCSAKRRSSSQMVMMAGTQYASPTMGGRSIQRGAQFGASSTTEAGTRAADSSTAFGRR
jgi:hypothetical protein